MDPDRILRDRIPSLTPNERADILTVLRYEYAGGDRITNMADVTELAETLPVGELAAMVGITLSDEE